MGGVHNCIYASRLRSGERIIGVRQTHLDSETMIWESALT